jgi:hypothetical protein
MKRFLISVFAMLALVAAPVVLAQNDPTLGQTVSDAVSSVAVAAPGALDPNTWAILLAAASTVVSVPLTALVKRFSGTEGTATVIVNIGLNAVIAGVLPWIAGAYPPDVGGALLAFGATVLGSLADKIVHSSFKSQMLALV